MSFFSLTTIKPIYYNFNAKIKINKLGSKNLMAIGISK